MAKALRGEAVVPLPRVSNNTGHGRLPLAWKVISFQTLDPVLCATICLPAQLGWIYSNTILLFPISHCLKRFHALFGLAEWPGKLYKPLRPIHIQELGNQSQKSQPDKTGQQRPVPFASGDITIK